MRALTISEVINLCCNEDIVLECDALPREAYRTQEDKDSFITMLIEGDQENEDFMNDEYHENGRTR